MNRQQAEHILDAYVRLRMQGGDEEAAGALREVVLDAMTEYRSITVPNVSDNSNWHDWQNWRYGRETVTC